MNIIKNWIIKHQVASFFILTFLITWGLMFPFTRFAFQDDSDLAMIPLMWGIFGPALAGILVTRVISPQEETKNRRVPRLAFFGGLILSALVLLGNYFLQGNMPQTTIALIAVLIFFLIIVIPSAIVISSVFSNNQSVRNYLQSLVKPRGSVAYYLVALLFSPFCYWVGALITNWLDLPAYYTPPTLSGWIGVQTLGMAFIYQFFFANVLGEEIGWRGFALPRLQAMTSPLAASLIIALFWFPWHLPLKLGNPDLIPMIYYALHFIPTSIFLTWLYNRTKGSILAVGVAHVVGNLAGKFLFPITDARLVVSFIAVLVLILLDRMWKKLPSDHQAVYRSGEFDIQIISRTI